MKRNLFLKLSIRITLLIIFQLEKIHQITSIAGNWKIKQIYCIYQCSSNYSMNKSITKEDAQVFNSGEKAYWLFWNPFGQLQFATSYYF